MCNRFPYSDGYRSYPIDILTSDQIREQEMAYLDRLAKNLPEARKAVNEETQRIIQQMRGK